MSGSMRAELSRVIGSGMRAIVRHMEVGRFSDCWPADGMETGHIKRMPPATSRRVKDSIGYGHYDINWLPKIVMHAVP
jgi:hypothetical protein